MKNAKAAVIGSGFGGLALAIRLQAAGYQTKIFEKRDQPGGRAYVYRDNGFTFDAGPTVITAPHCIEDLFNACGKEMTDYIEMMPIKPFYRLFWEDGFTFDYCNDEESLKKQIMKKSPKDWDGYLRFLEYTKEVFREGYEKLAHVAFPNFWSMVRVAPQLVRLSAFRSVYKTVAKYIKDDQLRQAFSFHSLLVGGNPFSSSSIYTLIHFLERKWGVYFPKGGTGALVKALVRLFEDMGGKIEYNAEVSEITTAGGKVTGLRNGDKTENFDVIASNADVAHTYRDLLKSEKSVSRQRNKVLGQSHSMSLFLIYFGASKKYPDLAHHNVLFGPRYRALLKDIFDTGELADDFSLYMHAPTVSDPSLAPEGHEGFYVLSPVPHLGKSNINWDEMGPIYADKIIDYLDERYLPDLKKHLVTKRIFTPYDFKMELNSHMGSAFSIEPVLRQSAYFRTHNRDDSLRGLYFVGAGTHPGAGVPGVVNSAIATFDLIDEDFNERSSFAEA